MPPDRIVFIRHGEEHDTPGVDVAGRPDEQSLVARGWQRADALIGLFADAPGAPDFLYTSAVAPGSESRRPGQTIAALAAVLAARNQVPLDQQFEKKQPDALMRHVQTRSGTVLICWEHSQIAACVAALPNAPATPEKWPSDRYDLIWQLDRAGDRWHFSERNQALLPGDQPRPHPEPTR